MNERAAPAVRPEQPRLLRGLWQRNFITASLTGPLFMPGMLLLFFGVVMEFQRVGPVHHDVSLVGMVLICAGAAMLISHLELNQRYIRAFRAALEARR